MIPFQCVTPPLWNHLEALEPLDEMQSHREERAIDQAPQRLATIPPAATEGRELGHLGRIGLEQSEQPVPGDWPVPNTGGTPPASKCWLRPIGERCPTRECRWWN